MEVKTCTKCGAVKPLTEFTFNDLRKGKRHGHCRDCARSQVRAHYRANRKMYIDKARKRTAIQRQGLRQEIRAYLSLHPCVDCGEADQRCLDFDHVRGRKTAAIAMMVRLAYSWTTIAAEIEKCDVRCANCHRKRTAERREQKRLEKAIRARSSTG